MAEPLTSSPGLPARADDVLEVVDAIPPGRVLTYGDVGEILGDRGPRFVGNVLRRFGSDVCWWRVLRADGSAAPGLADRAVEHWRTEAVPLRRDDRDPTRVRVDLRRARWDGVGLPDLAGLNEVSGPEPDGPAGSTSRAFPAG